MASEKLAVVAPYAGAWIEIWTSFVVPSVKWSLPTRERGLKYVCPLQLDIVQRAPYAGAWIEIAEPGHWHTDKASLPTRERGLKYPVRIGYTVRRLVAPYAGAWIEINIEGLTF